MASRKTDAAAATPTRRHGAVMADVAALAGVSMMTVSRVLNDNGTVKAETRARVLAAVRQLDYEPNTAARTLVTGRSRTLGVVTLDTTLYGPVSTLLGVEQAARSAGYFVSITSLRSLDLESILAAVANLHSQAVEGIVVIAPHERAVQALRHLPTDVALVAVEGGGAGHVPVAAVDQYAGAHKATQHLLSLGHRDVPHIGGPIDWLESRGRERGWRDALQEADIEPPPLLIGDWSPRSGYELGQRIIAKGAATAVFTANDQMALGFLRALREARLDVPGDVSVVGFDDIPEAAYLSPPLTTIRQDFTEVGRRTVDLLRHKIRNTTESGQSAVVHPELVVRESTAAPRH